MGRKIIVPILAIGLVVGGYYLFSLWRKFRVVVPEYKAPPEQRVKIDQGWSEEQRHHFHYTPQGTRLLPYQ